MRSRATSPLVVYGRTRRRYFNVGAKTLMRLSGDEDYELAFDLVNYLPPEVLTKTLKAMERKGIS